MDKGITFLSHQQFHTAGTVVDIISPPLYAK